MTCIGRACMPRAARHSSAGVHAAVAVWRWSLSVRLGAWNRGDRTHGELALHLAAEFVLLYTVIVSPGYFLARRDLPVVGMFGILAALTVTALAVART